MSQEILQSLTELSGLNYPVSQYNANYNIIEEALRLVGANKEEDDLPDYYDDLLMQLIDSVPLEG